MFKHVTVSNVSYLHRVYPISMLVDKFFSIITISNDRLFLFMNELFLNGNVGSMIQRTSEIW